MNDLEAFASSPAILENGKWRWPSAQELREKWLLPPEYEATIDALSEQVAYPSIFEKSALAVAYYRVQTASARLKSRRHLAQAPRENLTLLHVAQILNDDETWLDEISRAGFATTHFLGYFESVKSVGGARFRRLVAATLGKLRETDDDKCGQTLKKLLDVAGPKALEGLGNEIAELLESKLDMPRLFALQTLPKLKNEALDWKRLQEIAKTFSNQRPAIVYEAAKFVAFCETI